MGFWTRIRRSAFYRSIYRNGYPDTDRNRALVVLNSLALHIHPVKVPRRALRLSYTWGLGGASLLLFLVLTVTGVWLMFFYVPVVPGSYESMHLLQTGVFLGAFVRNLHRWAAHGMVLTVWLHMTRVLYTGAYKQPRTFNWVLGLLLLVVTVLLAYTGYLLPWDQLAYWAVTVGTNLVRWVPLIGRYLQQILLGGFALGQATLVRWYTLHVILLPLIGLGLMGLHFWRIRKDGGISTPVPRAEEERVYTWPHLVATELIMALAVLLLLAILATFFNAPLLDMANPSLTPPLVKAPWYLVGLQELLLHMHPTLAGFLVPAAVVIGLGAIPYLDERPEGTGVWFGSRGRAIAARSGGYAAVTVVGLTLLDQFLTLPAMAQGAHGVGPVVAFLLGRAGAGPVLAEFAGLTLIPLLVMAAVLWGGVLLLRRLYTDLDRRDFVLAFYSLFLASFLVLTLVGAVFRGPGMQLIWPWR